MSDTPRPGLRFFLMSLNLTQMANDLAFMVADLPESITADAPDGRVLACVSGLSSRSRKLAEEGLMPSFNMEFTVQARLLVDGVSNAAPLTERQKVTFSRNGLKYRIDSINEGADGAGVTYSCTQVTS